MASCFDAITGLDDFKRPTSYTLGHAVFPYTKASIKSTISYKSEYLSPAMSGSSLQREHFEIGSFYYRTITWDFVRIGKPPDLPMPLQEGGFGDRKIIEYEITADGIDFDIQSGQSTYSCSGRYVYLEKSTPNVGDLIIKYPRTPIDGTVEINAETSLTHAKSALHYTSSFYSWTDLAGAELPAQSETSSPPSS
jgi:hypothetical protein